MKKAYYCKKCRTFHSDEDLIEYKEVDTNFSTTSCPVCNSSDNLITSEEYYLSLGKEVYQKIKSNVRILAIAMGIDEDELYTGLYTYLESGE